MTLSSSEHTLLYGRTSYAWFIKMRKEMTKVQCRILFTIKPLVMTTNLQAEI
jgi:hypothetical protein